MAVKVQPAISIGELRAIYLCQFQIRDVERIAINIRAIFQQLLFGDSDAAVFIDGALINRP